MSECPLRALCHVLRRASVDFGFHQLKLLQWLFIESVMDVGRVGMRLLLFKYLDVSKLFLGIQSRKIDCWPEIEAEFFSSR